MTTTVHALVAICSKKSAMSRVSTHTMADMLHDAGGERVETAFGLYGALICSQEYFNRFSGKPVGYNSPEMHMQIRMYEQTVIQNTVRNTYNPDLEQ